MIEEYLQSFKIFDEKEIKDFVSVFHSRSMRKNDFLIKQGDSCGEVAFIISGIFRSFYYTPDGIEMTYCFRFPNDLLTSYSSFITGGRSLENLQAISDTELLVIKKEQIDKITLNDYKWTMFLKVIAEQNYIELEKRIFHLQTYTALERYKSLIENQPAYIQQIPLQYLASYLNVTQRHLSRIRKQISF